MTDYTYQGVPQDALSPGNPTVKRSDGLFIAVGTDTPEALAYAAWLAEGNLPTAAEAGSAPATFSGNQWGLAIGDLGLAPALLDALAASKAKDRHRYGLIGRETRLQPDDPLLMRICARADAPIDLAAVAAHARAMPR